MPGFFSAAYPGLLYLLAGTVLLIVGFKLERYEDEAVGAQWVGIILFQLVCFGVGGFCYLVGTLMLRFLLFRG